MRGRLGLSVAVGLGMGLAACASAPPVPPAPPPPPVEVPFQAAPPPDWVTGAWPAHLPEAEYAAAVATSTDARTAFVKARAALELRLFGPPARRPFETLPPALADFVDPDLSQHHTQEGLTSALEVASKAKIAEQLKAWAQALTPESDLPEPHPSGERVLVFGAEVHDARAHLDRLIEHLRFRRAARFACAEAPVRTSTCTAPHPELMQDALQAFLSGVTLDAIPPDGVPFRAGVGALRPLRLRVAWRSPGRAPQPLAEVPVRVIVQGRTQVLLSDEAGQVSLPWPQDIGPEATAGCGLDAQRLLGELRDVWPEPPKAQVGLRALTPEHLRLALSLNETSVGHSSVDGSESLRRTLMAQGWGSVYYLDDSRAPAVPIQGPALAALADQAQGQLDLILVGTLDSHFASQMGARSVWYEATASVALYDAWSGQKIEQLETSARAVAIGEAAAAKAALEALGAQLAQRTQEALRAYRPAPLLQ